MHLLRYIDLEKAESLYIVNTPPEYLCRLQNLKELRLKTLPKSIENLQNLNVIKPEVSTGDAYIDSVEIIVFGKHNSGKSLLMKKLCGDQISQSSDLDVYQHSFNILGKDVKFTFFEPGSSEESYAVYPLYIYNSDYFIVVIDGGLPYEEQMAQASYRIRQIGYYTCFSKFAHERSYVMLLVDGKAEAHGENRLDEEKLHNEFHELPQDRVIINVVYLSIADLKKDELQQQFVKNILKMTSSFCSSRINFKNGTTFLTLPQHIIVRGKIIRDIQPDLLIKAIRILPSPILQEKHVFRILDKANFFTGNTQAPILCEQIIKVLRYLGYFHSGQIAVNNFDHFPQKYDPSFPDYVRPNIIYELDYKFLPSNLLISLTRELTSYAFEPVSYGKSLMHLKFERYPEKADVILFNRINTPILRIYIYADQSPAHILLSVLDVINDVTSWLGIAEHCIVIEKEIKPLKIQKLLAESKKGEQYYQGEFGRYSIDDLLCRAFENYYYMAKTNLLDENSDPYDFDILYDRMTDEI